MTVSCDWDGTIETAKINAIHEEFELIIKEKDRTLSYISVENISTQITKVIEDKSLADLLESEYNILNKQTQQYTSASICRALERAKDRVEAIIETIRQGNKASLLFLILFQAFLIHQDLEIIKIRHSRIGKVISRRDCLLWQQVRAKLLHL